MADSFEQAADPDEIEAAYERGRHSRPETDLGERNASRHHTEDYRRRGGDPEHSNLFTDPVTGEPLILP